MTAIMIYHIKSKYTAVGRKEMVMFFYLYLVDVILEFLLVSNIISSASTVYNYFAALHVGFICTTFWILLLNGFVGFQWAEDGTPLSLWSFRLSGLVVFAISVFISLATFLGFAGLSSSSAFALYFLFLVFNLVCFLVYVVTQIVLVFNTLEDRWPLGDIFFGVIFFLAGVSVMLFASSDICKLALHYVDGMFFGTIMILLAVMMVYKYWDSITKEDLEFSVGGIPHSWDLRDGTDMKLLGERKSGAN